MGYHLQICFNQAQHNQATASNLSAENAALSQRCSSLEEKLARLTEMVESNLTRSSSPPINGLRSHHSSLEGDHRISYMERWVILRRFLEIFQRVPWLFSFVELQGKRQKVLAKFSLDMKKFTWTLKLVAFFVSNLACKNELFSGLVLSLLILPFVLSFCRSIGLHDVQLSELSIRQDLQDLKTTNGVMVWRISDFSRRLREAETGKTASLYSPPFYTSPAGYKVCARLYPNGDGIGKGTHLSLFFVVMKGDFDALLPWPFRQKVSLMLLDQSTTNPRHIVETFRPDPSSSSFQRPQQEMNVASGCPLFHPLSALNHTSYLQDDTIFLKIVVHQNGLQAPDQVWTCLLVPESRKFSLFLGFPHLEHCTFEITKLHLYQPPCSEALRFHDNFFSAGVLAASAP